MRTLTNEKGRYIMKLNDLVCSFFLEFRRTYVLVYNLMCFILAISRFIRIVTLTIFKTVQNVYCKLIYFCRYKTTNREFYRDLQQVMYQPGM